MVHLRNRVIPAAAMAMLVCLAVTQVASAKSDDDGVREKIPKDPVQLECDQPAGTFCIAPSAGNQAVVPLKVAKRAFPLEGICFTLRFEGDLVDAGESVAIALSSNPSFTFGFENLGPAPLSERTVCLTADHRELIAMLSEKKPTLYVFMDIGSATLVDVEVFLDAD